MSDGEVRHTAIDEIEACNAGSRTPRHEAQFLEPALLSRRACQGFRGAAGWAAWRRIGCMPLAQRLPAIQGRARHLMKAVR
jgi:hypothetical protein